MIGKSTASNTTRPAGYLALVERFGLEVISNWHLSYVAEQNMHRVEVLDAVTEETYPSRYWPGDGLGEHLEFALKYDGTNLAILSCIFEAAPTTDLTAFIESKPRGKYARRLWYLYELLTGNKLPIDDLKTGGYIDLLDSAEYVTTATGRPARRQKINDNLLGTATFCPTVRRTDVIQQYVDADLPTRCREVVADYSPDVLRRALSYLYSKETKSSFEIEHVTPSATRSERFIGMLELAETEDFCDETRLIDLQHRIVDSRFRAEAYRPDQNYVGESVAWQREKIHYVSPRPEDVPLLMEGLLATHLRMESGDVPAVAHAAAIAYGFVYVHPFDDGNGRIHRFLIHNILARRGFTPSGIMFPVSAAMLKDPVAYDQSLESFSRALLPFVDYQLDENGEMTVKNATMRWYQYIDMTAQVEALFRFIERTIETELQEELAFLSSYDVTKSALQNIVDMPDRLIDLFIRFCLQNDGHLSARKRKAHFSMLTDAELSQMEQAVQAGYPSPRGYSERS